MSKTIKIPVRYGDYETTHAIDVSEFAAEVARGLVSPVLPALWYRCGLVMATNGERVLTPRGEDLLASVDSIPDDPEPASAAAKCPACEGTGERVLFVYAHPCDECEGTGVQASEQVTCTFSTDTKSRPTNSNIERLETDLEAFHKAVIDAYRIPFWRILDK